MRANAGARRRVEVVLFDIDGTLISTGGASDRAWGRAFRELYDLEVDVQDYTGKGVTDPEVGLASFRGALGRKPEPREMATLMALRLRYLPSEVDGSPGYRVMSGAEALLQALSAGGGSPAGADHRQPGGGGAYQAGARGPEPFLHLRRLRVGRGPPGGVARVAPRARRARVRRLARPGLLPRRRRHPTRHRRGPRRRDPVAGVATGEYGTKELLEAGADFAIASLEEGLPGLVRRDVLVEPEEVVGVVLALQRLEPVVLLRPVGLADRAPRPRP